MKKEEKEVSWTVPGDSPWFWIILVTIIALTPGWFIPKSSQMIFGIPKWAFFSIIVIAALAIFLMWAAYYLWRPTKKTNEQKVNKDG